jgi:hypothetical protein
MVSQPSYVRRCRGCGTADTHSIFGRADMVLDDEPWACRFCPSTVWCLDRLSTSGVAP